VENFSIISAPKAPPPIESEYKSPFAVTFRGFLTSVHGKNCTSSPQADLIFKSREVEEETLRKFCLFPGWSMVFSPREKLEEEKRLHLLVVVASLKALVFE
jgi:hypothetical protein